MYRIYIELGKFLVPFMPFSAAFTVLYALYQASAFYIQFVWCSLQDLTNSTFTVLFRVLRRSLSTFDKPSSSFMPPALALDPGPDPLPFIHQAEILCRSPYQARTLRFYYIWTGQNQGIKTFAYWRRRWACCLYPWQSARLFSCMVLKRQKLIYKHISRSLLAPKLDFHFRIENYRHFLFCKSRFTATEKKKVAEQKRERGQQIVRYNGLKGEKSPKGNTRSVLYPIKRTGLASAVQMWRR